MKKHSFITEITLFSLIFLFFILPPLFYSFFSLDLPFNWSFPFQALILFFLALGLFLFYNDSSFSITNLLPCIFTLGLLFFTSLIFKIIDIIFIKNAEKVELILPDNFLAWLFCILNFLFSAFYEEVLYRFYFPQALISFFEGKSNKKIIPLICELITALLFAFAHLYLGYLSVINAFFAHIILRITFKKSKAIWSGFIAHFIYNMISLILL